MVDTDLIVHEVRKYGHSVEQVIAVPQNAGDFEFIVDGNTLTLSEARALPEADQAK